MKRVFFIIHSLGIDQTHAETAGEALARTWLPLGFRDACAVIDAELVTQQLDKSCTGPFRAFLGQPVTEGGTA